MRTVKPDIIHASISGTTITTQSRRGANAIQDMEQQVLIRGVLGMMLLQLLKEVCFTLLVNPMVGL